MPNEDKKPEAQQPAPAAPQEAKPAGLFNRLPEDDVDFTTDIRSAILVQTPSGGRSIVWMTLILLAAALVWAYFAEIEEITRGEGKVIPSRQIQVVQNLEGGIVAEILVSEGDVIDKDQLLLRIDDTRFSAPFRESRVKYMALKAKVARLRAESLGAILEIEDDIKTEFPSIDQREL